MSKKYLVMITDISHKAHHVLNVILLSLFLILIRLWYLSVINHEEYVELAKKPQLKTVTEMPLRGTIRDRFNIPLAINQLQYDAAISYDQIRSIPFSKKIRDEKGKVQRIYPRKEHIKKVSELLAKKLNLNSVDIEDIFYGKACLFPSSSFTLKENISEELYYQLKGLERIYPGIKTIQVSKRVYPKGKVASDVLGYLGNAQSAESFSVLHEIEELEHYLKAHHAKELIFLPKGFASIKDIEQRLQTLHLKAKQFQTKIGKAGIESRYDDLLRGTQGKHTYEISTKGSIIRELPGSKNAEPGSRLLLNISSELQEFAEALLAENALIRDQKFPKSGKDHHLITPPWIKSGAIVAMIPQTGEVVAMASYPRMDSNDFISSNPKTSQWLETRNYIAKLWDGKTSLEREFYSSKHKQFYTEEKRLTYETYLDYILSVHSHARKSMQRIPTIHMAVKLQKELATLLDLSEQPYMHALIDTIYSQEENHRPSSFGINIKQMQDIENALSQHAPLAFESRTIIDKILGDIPHNDDKLLVIDLARLFADSSRFNESLLLEVGQDTLSSYRKLCQCFAIIKEIVQDCSKNHFHVHDFKKWREEHFKDYLKQKRKEEKDKHLYQKPYIEYLKQLETKQFKEFWEKYQTELITLFLLNIPIENSDIDSSSYADCFSEYRKNKFKPAIESAYEYLQSRLKSVSSSALQPYLYTMRSYSELNHKLYGHYPQLHKRKGSQTEKDLAAGFYPQEGYGYGRSFAFRQSTPLGSIFKIITAYEAIRQNYVKGVYDNKSDLNPLTIIDDIQPSIKTPQGIVLGYHDNGEKITRRYKGGTLPRTHNRSLGKVDYIGAFQRSSNIYFSLLASDVIEDPNDLTMASLKFGFGNKTGVDLPGEISGNLPKDLKENRSGLYAFAIGQHSLIATPLQTAVMISSLGNGGEILKPQILRMSIGDKKKEKLPFSEVSENYQNYLEHIGIFFPFFLSTESQESSNAIQFYDKVLYRKLFLPASIKEYLLEGMYSVIAKGAARAEMIRYLYQNTAAMKNYLKLKYQLAGKTSSAEIAYHPTLDRECPTILCKDTWFGGISFKQKEKTSAILSKKEEIPELVVIVYLKYGDFGKETAPLAAEMVTKWREISSRQSSF